MVRWWLSLVALAVGLAPPVPRPPKPPTPARLPSYEALAPPLGDEVLEATCAEHSKPVIRRRVLRGINAGREYYCCGHELPCDHFEWCPAPETAASQSPKTAPPPAPPAETTSTTSTTSVAASCAPALAGAQAQARRSEEAAAGLFFPETLNGTVARIMYRRATEGFTVARVTPFGSEEHPDAEHAQDVAAKTATGEGLLSRSAGSTSARHQQQKKRRSLATVGVKASACLATARVGDVLRLTGRWTTHPRYGRQFEAHTAELALPHTESTQTGFATWLGSGVVQGVGRATASKIAERLGPRAEEWLARVGEARRSGADDHEAARVLAEAFEWRDDTKRSVVSRKLAAAVADAVAADAVARRVVVDLVDELALPIDAALALFKAHDRVAAAAFRKDPHGALLAAPGWGFRRADAVVLGLRRRQELPDLSSSKNDDAPPSGEGALLTPAYAPDAPLRLRYGLVHALAETSAHGHCAQPLETLLDLAGHPLGPLAAPPDPPPDPAALRAALDQCLASGQIRALDRPDAPGDPLCLTPWLDEAERAVANAVAVRADGRATSTPPLDRAGLVRLLGAAKVDRLSPRQVDAVLRAAGGGVAVLAGGPGTGKTHAARAVVEVWRRRDPSTRVALAAPTARGAAALGAAVGERACTLHRLLEWSPRDGAFARRSDRPLEADLVVVDEVSMLEVPLMAKLVRALPPSASLLLIGDPDQLPSIGPGALLRDLVDASAGLVGHVRLDHIFRQQGPDVPGRSEPGFRASDVAENARAVNAGRVPERFRTCLEETDAAGETRLPDGAVLLDVGPGADAARLAVVETVRRLAKHGLDPLADVQVLAPMKRGGAGVHALNRALQGLVHEDKGASGSEIRPVVENSPDDDVETSRADGKPPAPLLGDRVIQLTNDYDVGVFNGDVGAVDETMRNGSFVAKFHVGQRGFARVMYAPSDVGDAVALAYCLTVHKAQGNEYPVVVLPLVPEAAYMLTRPLLYTAISRAKRLLVLVGDSKLLAAGVQRSHGLGASARLTGLCHRLDALDRRRADSDSLVAVDALTTADVDDPFDVRDFPAVTPFSDALTSPNATSTFSLT